MAQPTQSAVRNRLPAVLPPDAFELLAPALEPVALSLRQVLYDADEPIGSVHFVETGMVSMLALLETGDLMEVGVVGPEGLVGMPVVLGAPPRPWSRCRAPPCGSGHRRSGGRSTGTGPCGTC